MVGRQRFEIEQAIDDLVAELRQALAASDGDYKGPAKTLYTRTIGKLASALGEARQILIAPDGALNLIPFGALIDGDGKHLIERWSFTYLSSGRDLLRLGESLDSKQGPVIVADPRFDLEVDDEAKAKSRGLRASDAAWKAGRATTDEVRIPVREETAQVRKEQRQVGEVGIRKEVDVETKRISEPVTQTRVVAERRAVPPGEQYQVDPNATTLHEGETVRVPVVKGRRRFHTAAFLHDEARFADYERARAWERANLDRLLTF